VFQLKEEIGVLKDSKLSAEEFCWKVDVADEKKYDEIQRQYSSYLRNDQKVAIAQLVDKLIEGVIKSCRESDNTVLDVATGMGRFVLPLAEKGPDELAVIGTDVDEKPLRGTMAKARRAGTYGKISLIVTDAKRLCFKKNAIFTVSSNFGFDNVREASLAFKECARILQPGGKIVLSSLWYREDSQSMKLAEEHHVADIASELRLTRTLRETGLVLDWVETVYSGVWPYNPMDLLPVEGEEYQHVVAQARKPES
jgi:ubiquinone/menaquinone biosynthesis C-methylase UbiE